MSTWRGRAALVVAGIGATGAVAAWSARIGHASCAAPDDWLASYSGVLLDVTVTRAHKVKCFEPGARAKEARRPVGAYRFSASDRADSGATHFVAHHARSCADFPKGTVVDVDEATSCCDGDSGVPCLYQGLGGRFVRPAADAGRPGTKR